MFKKVGYRLIIGLSIMLLLLSACAGATKDSSAENEESTEQKTEAVSAENADENDDKNLIEPHKDLNQEPVPLEMERSEERRVGKECRTRWWRREEKKKKRERKSR